MAEPFSLTTLGETEANALLIAAAPELLRLCREYLAWLDRAPNRECVSAIIEQMRALVETLPVESA
jgi:hypothetical protein